MPTPLYSLREIAQTLGCPFDGTDRSISTFLIDSRSLTVADGVLFFALKTHRDDGHHYIQDLYDRGVRAFVVQESYSASDSLHEACLVRVADPLQALQQLAATVRQRLQMPVVGITGSNGKTTLKEFAYQLLREQMQVTRSPKSFNSAIGVPLSILSLDTAADVALVEAGISEPGEMSCLEQMIRPDIVVLTNIGGAHGENFGSPHEKAVEKLKLAKDARVLIAPMDDPVVAGAIRQSAHSCTVRGWSMTSAEADLYVEEVHYSPTNTTLRGVLHGRAIQLSVPLTDRGSVSNVCALLLLVEELRPGWQPIDGYAELEPVSMRLEVLEGEEGMLLLNDTYSADLDSLAIALDFMQRRNVGHQPTTVVLSPMAEARTRPMQVYEQVARLIAQHHPHQLVLVGSALEPFVPLFVHEMEQAAIAHETIPAVVRHFDSVQSLLQSQPSAWWAGHMVLLKGARTAHFESIVQALLRRVHQTILHVNLSALQHNLDLHRALLPEGMRMVAMIKAFGYGTGSYEVAKLLEQHHVDYLAVAVADEGKALREHGIRTPIIVMNPEASAFGQMTEYHLEPNLYSFDILDDFVHHAEQEGLSQYPIHLKWDTGMHRLGFAPEEVEHLPQHLGTSDAVRIASVFTHLSVADDPTEDDYTQMQLDTLDQIATVLQHHFAYPILKHALNTSGIQRYPHYRSDMVRLGIGLYGLSPLATDPLGLQPAAALRSVILQVRDLPEGATVGYGRKGVLHRPSRIGVVPIGYADGIPRQIGCGRVRLRTADGQLVPTCGNVCMDTLMVDLTDAPNAVAGSEITIFDAELPITQISDACGTIHYEILARLSSRIARHYYYE